jgi:uncharacterized protein YpuA (DUF1002 family)
MLAKTKALVIVLTLTIFLTGVTMPALAEEKPADNMQLVQEKIKADKKLFVADNMQLTEKEAKAFWPVYESYQKDLRKHNDQVLKLIDDYAKNYETMTDQTAQNLTNKYLALESERVKLLQSYVPKFSKAVGSKKAARYMQLENKINAVIRFELAANIPLVK